MAECVGCGDELPEERAALGYSYCVKKECVKEHMTPLRMLAVGVNKAADQFVLWDDEAKRRAQAGEFRKDSRRQGAVAPSDSVRLGEHPVHGPQETARAPRGRVNRSQLPGRPDQWQRIWIYNEQGIKPDDIAPRVGLSRYDVTQVILARNSMRKSHP